MGFWDALEDAGEGGEVKRISALRDEGKSFRRTRVSSRWCGAGAVASGDVRERDHASPLRKRVFADESAGADEGLPLSAPTVCLRVAEISRPDCRSAVWLRSSHWVSQCPARKSGCATMPRSMSMLVFTPLMEVSARARWALWTQSGQEEAVMMSFAIRLSKSADTMAGWPLMRCVSMRIPLPVGNWKEVILPMDKDQSLWTFSAVMRSWIEWAGGETSGSRVVLGSPQPSNFAPWARSSWALTISVMEIDSVIVCSTWRRGLTSRK